MKSPAEAAATLRAEELRRIQEIRSLVITSVNNQPIRIEDVVEGGRLAARTVARRTGRGRQQPDAVGADRLLQRRQRAAVGVDSDSQGRRPRRDRQGAVHRPHVERRGDDARPERHQGQGRRDQRPGIRPVVARDEDRALLRPHRIASPHHRDRDRKPAAWASCSSSRSCSCS